MANHVEQSGGKKTLKSYLIGLALSLILTLLAFALVQKHLLTTANLYITLGLLAIAQFYVQSVCFLRINSSKEGQWHLLPYLFSIVIIAILAGGTMWIMYNLNYYMFN
ncbi:MAG: cytochrome o ubiquinol oxidase subunit IV [Gammaproteobacteria bacterium RIFCSPHIGHO2_12_FULL_43_28]|nr:MAG: cytochrome o ubiquinol oxidase subunit IV [Gammaproteobacteria bacterium RIFCSPHIGHO2_12_FULL_43_28]